MTEGTLEEIKAGLVRTQQTIEQLSISCRPRAARQWIPCSYSQANLAAKIRIHLDRTDYTGAIRNRFTVADSKCFRVHDRLLQTRPALTVLLHALTVLLLVSVVVVSVVVVSVVVGETRVAAASAAAAALGTQPRLQQQRRKQQQRR